MAFCVYQRSIENGREILNKTDQKFSLAGRNLIYKAWKNLSEPLNQGWHVNADELIRIHSAGAFSYESTRLVIDFDPTADWRIGLIEILDIYVFTSSDDDGGVEWSTFMIRGRTVLYQEFKEGTITRQEIDRIKARVENPNYEKYEKDFVEFLYLRGEEAGWNWGASGRTNASFIEGPARDFFRKYF